MIEQRANKAAILIGASLSWIILTYLLWNYHGALIQEGALIQLWMIRGALIISGLLVALAWGSWIWILGKSYERAHDSMAGQAALSVLSAMATLALDLMARNELIRELPEDDLGVIITSITEKAFELLIAAGAINPGPVDNVGLTLQAHLEEALTEYHEAYKRGFRAARGQGPPSDHK